MQLFQFLGKLNFYENNFHEEVYLDLDSIVPRKFTKGELCFQSVKVRCDEPLFVRRLLCLLLCDPKTLRCLLNDYRIPIKGDMCLVIDSCHSRVNQNQQNLYPKSYFRSQATAV